MVLDINRGALEAIIIENAGEIEVVDDRSRDLQYFKSSVERERDIPPAEHTAIEGSLWRGGGGGKQTGHGVGQVF